MLSPRRSKPRSTSRPTLPPRSKPPPVAESNTSRHQDRVAVAILQRRMRHDPSPVNLRKPEPPIETHRPFVPLEADQAHRTDPQIAGPRERATHQIGADPHPAVRLVDGDSGNIERSVEFELGIGLKNR